MLQDMDLFFSGSMMLIPPPSVPAHICESLSLMHKMTLLFRPELAVVYSSSSLPLRSKQRIP